MTDTDSFEFSGFLSPESAQTIPAIQASLPELFTIAYDLNTLVMRLTADAAEAAQVTSMEPAAIAVRVLMRACGTFQSVLLLASRGNVADARTLVRGLVEDSFMIAAICKDPEKFLKLFKDDANASRKRQTKLVIDNGWAEGETLERLQAIAAELTGKNTPVKDLAGHGVLEKQYLLYSRLSDDSAHPSATSLNHHVNAELDKSGWRYQWKVADRDETSATLHAAFQGLVPVAIGVAEFLKLSEYGGALNAILLAIENAPPSKSHI
ncbi:MULTISPECIES: DUF5677 domain-containing protein [Pseudomonas]|uniref:Uncharacterized protein n=2 Tax=Pseudomonas TaxID=286 RepID=A0A7W2M0K2_9PSED|nr:MULTISPECIES: DUF5677 domain-containing protein [Pseudomonas]MBA6134841.1 hypothetical protein [Pseudomonas juntendi]MBA6150489.1 hypothetical protein [Pseudomonas juntendi]MDF3874073.1 DUF5677 domain-containing protein [Pseudomonas putida]MDF3880344.1 DUF5677 domain-containing protein [Pseudomonas putida]MDG9811913.1 DUF5677 domain-containing protein [Pseudomonas juntendi]